MSLVPAEVDKFNEPRDCANASSFCELVDSDPLIGAVR